MDEFKLQFVPALLIGGSSKSKDRSGNKYYNPAFIQGRRIVRVSLKSFKTATEAQDYAKAVVKRYGEKARAALIAFVEQQNSESQDVEPEN